MSLASTPAPMTPLSTSPGSIVWSFVAPYSPSAPASASGFVADVDASTVSPSSRAFVSSSSVLVVGFSPVSSFSA